MLPMVQAISCGIFTPEQARGHMNLIHERLLFPDGARLMDKPLDYHGGPEKIFRRAESAAFFGREIGLMYTHSHLRYAEAAAALDQAGALWDALLIVNPVAVGDVLPNAAPRQRNAYFSSSDAAFRDRYQASAEWGAGEGRRDPLRRGLAHLFERPRSLFQHGGSARFWAEPPVWREVSRRSSAVGQSGRLGGRLSCRVGVKHRRGDFRATARRNR